MKERITIGCRVRIKTLEEKPKQTGPGIVGNEESWRKEYGGHDALLLKRTDGGALSVLMLEKGVGKLEKKKAGIVIDSCSWIQEDDMVLVNRNFEENLDFIDWYQKHIYDFCGDCGAWWPGHNRDFAKDPKTGEYVKCPNPDCPSHFEEELLEESEGYLE